MSCHTFDPRNRYPNVEEVAEQVGVPPEALIRLHRTGGVIELEVRGQVRFDVDGVRRDFGRYCERKGITPDNLVRWPLPLMTRETPIPPRSRPARPGSDGAEQ
jgi:hypothetical protein